MTESFEDASSGEWRDGGLPSETQLVMLCLDYLRDIRRRYEPRELLDAEGLDANSLSVAIYALSRSFVRPAELSVMRKEGNDPFFDRSKVQKGIFPVQDDPSNLSLPDINTMNKEILYDPDLAQTNTDPPNDAAQESTVDRTNRSALYEYNDAHFSNTQRFYLFNGLASGPLSLGEITAAGLAGLGARSRLDADKEMVNSNLFEQFVSAVGSKGFFSDPANEGPSKTPMEAELKEKRAAEVYEERYRKVVAKFRQKLAAKAQQTCDDGDADSVMAGNSIAVSAAERMRQLREERTNAARSRHLHEITTTHNDNNEQKETQGSPIKSLTQKLTPLSPKKNPQNPIDLDEAERLKSAGNTYMQNKEYEEAAASYTGALKLSPAGPQSHVYYSNRAAAQLSMKKFEEAVLDSERSLALKPDYGKAHSRLGLAYFLLGKYLQAIEAYTVSLKYDPDSISSKNYLEKAKKRYASKKNETDQEEAPSSFSMVRELEKSSQGDIRLDQKEAENFKEKGNACMAKREYQLAFDSYSEAIRLCEDGKNSHVYFSNRAATLCYLERYKEAESDSERSLKLKPDYSKAHARLGLARFFLGDYEGAVNAYTTALNYDPDNSASKSYLKKAKARLGR
mmetsp:Transcript_6084/g.9662  ORF Transcript_6084/g.9662 Transcript_6084/m.9662 type:complete len:624 (-) Transcript_6084:150-2021(-)|eukprot:CAMPEP_0194251756 /NCGR_PEP_ID=MMETSP0158-20130606/26134_1 /TAXON_ID=33649 /ORGANISM="Thalassionema nitzschioides, Strain L26-B" /LENGTH=623 /DNA_ID=CAMNT_0038988981 /DNA_START=8 /DNA_END=1879 /DNA_ORIENTATION=-